MKFIFSIFSGNWRSMQRGEVILQNILFHIEMPSTVHSESCRIIGQFTDCKCFDR